MRDQMNIAQLVAGLESDSERNDTLRLLKNVLVDKDDALIRSLTGIIGDPSSIEDTNGFASILEVLGSKAFIPPLIDAISNGSPLTTTWLADYMYALGELLRKREEYWPAEESFVHLMGDWLLSTGGGEISWKAGLILAEIVQPSTRDYLLRGAVDQSLFLQTRLACVKAIVNQYPTHAPEILEKLAADPEPYVRDAVAQHQRRTQELERRDKEKN
jgi:HEAT repeat protein